MAIDYVRKMRRRLLRLLLRLLLVLLLWCFGLLFTVVVFVVEGREDEHIVVGGGEL